MQQYNTMKMNSNNSLLLVLYFTFKEKASPGVFKYIISIHDLTSVKWFFTISAIYQRLGVRSHQIYRILHRPQTFMVLLLNLLGTMIMWHTVGKWFKCIFFFVCRCKIWMHQISCYMLVFLMEENNCYFILK